MLHCSYRGMLMAALSGVLWAGCASAPPGSKPGAVTAAARGSNPTNASGVDLRVVEAHAHYVAGMVAEFSGDGEAAMKEFAEAAARDPGNEDLVADVSRRLLQTGKPEQALELLQRAAAQPGASGTLFGRLAQVYAVLGQDDQAITAGQTAIKRAPLSLPGYVNLFLLHLKKGHPKEAQAVLDEAAKQPEAPAEFLIGLGELYATLQRQAPSQKAASKATAAAVLQRALKLNPNSAYARLKLADDFNLLGDTRSATDIYRGLLDDNPDLPALHDEVRTKLKDIYREAGDYEKASEQLRAMVRENPANAAAYYELGDLAISAAEKSPEPKKKYAEAADYFEKTILIKDDEGGAYYKLANLQMILDRTAAARATLEKARTRFHDNFFSEDLLARVYSKEKDFTNALSHFTSAELLAKTTDPKLLNEQFYFDMGAAYERKGDFEQAEQAFTRALEYKPDFAEALNYYGYMLADRGVKLPRAREMIEKAVQAEPKNAAFLDSLGWVLFKLDQPAAALPQLLKAIELSEEPDATLYEHLGDIQAALKETAKARESWRKSLAIEPNPQIQRKLESLARP